MISLNSLVIIGMIVFLLILVMTLASVKWAYRFAHKVEALPTTTEQQKKGDYL